MNRLIDQYVSKCALNPIDQRLSWPAPGPIFRNDRSASLTNLHCSQPEESVTSAKVEAASVQSTDINKRVIDLRDQAGSRTSDNGISRKPGGGIHDELKGNRTDLVPRLDLEPPQAISRNAPRAKSPAPGCEFAQQVLLDRSERGGFILRGSPACRPICFLESAYSKL